MSDSPASPLSTSRAAAGSGATTTRPAPAGLSARSGAVSPREKARSTAEWSAFLEAELRSPVRVVLTRARKLPLRVRPFRTGDRGRPVTGLEVRLHALFATAPPEIRSAVASWIRSGDRATRACRTLDAWVETALKDVAPAKVRTERLVTRGERHDLAALMDDVMRVDFAGDATLQTRPPHATWGRRGPSKSRGSLRLGSYDPDARLVRIHPVLDQGAVPDWVVRYVLFHECLHALHPPKRGEGGRWIHHGPEFRRRERAYPDYARVIAWEKLTLRALVRSARRGEPLVVPRAAARSASTAATPAAKSPGQPGIAARDPVEEGLVPRTVRFLQSVLFPD